MIKLTIISILILLIISSSIVIATTVSQTIKNEIQLNTSPLLQSATSNDILVFCCNPPVSTTPFSSPFSSYYSPMLWFQEIDIEVKLVNSPDLPFYSIKGLSSDDFHNIVQDFLMNILKIDKGDKDKGDEKQIIDLFNPSSDNVLRDILSACPSPLFSQSRDQCVMSFSPYGRACVGVKTNKNINTIVKARMKYNSLLPLLLAIGIFCLFSATLLSNSKIFQYFLGMMIFILLGTVLMIIQIYKFSSKKLSKNDTITKPMSWSFLALLFTSYGTTVIWILRKNLKFIIITHWEFSLAYVVVFGVLGLLFTRVMRSYDDTKHMLRVTVRWIIRILALILIYNSSASPLISLSTIIIFSTFYIIRALFKFGGTSKNKTQ